MTGAEVSGRLWFRGHSSPSFMACAELDSANGGNVNVAQTKPSIGYRTRLLGCLALSIGLGACTGDVSPLPGLPEQDGSQRPVRDRPAPGDGEDSVDGEDSPVDEPEDTNTDSDKEEPPEQSPDAHGKLVMRRLNRAEYNNTVRDLLNTKLTPADSFPADDVDEGFDTLGSALTFSTVLAEQVEKAAGQLVDELFARPKTDAVRRRILSCEVSASNAATCVPAVLEPVMKSAYRRPVTKAEVSDLAAFAAAAQKSNADGTFGLAAALKVILLSPDFLYHVEFGDPEAAKPSPLSPHELASRLSYFLWSSAPDAVLTKLADEGTLQDPAVLAAQVTRMLDDERAQALVDNFAGQWLSIRNVDLVAPDADVFPSFTEAMRESMATETKMFFKELVDKDLPLANLLLSDFTFADKLLAQHYGLKGGATTFAKVPLSGSARFGLLTQQTFLMTTSYPDMTSPVKRGAWVLDQLLCDPPPAPPAGVPPLKPPPSGSKRTLREAQEEHRSSPACKGCHVQMDPIGLSFENFDPVGAYRTLDNGTEIDASGSLPDRGEFTDAKGLVTLLASDPRYPACVVERMMTFAVGRSFTSSEGKDYIATLAAPLQKGGSWRKVIHTVATSEAFLSRSGFPK